MTASRFIRQAHRWLGLSLVVLVLVNMVVFALGQAIEWLYYLPLIPLFLLMLSGLFMFFQPYFGWGRGAA